jgi:hypothetical protein
MNNKFSDIDKAIITAWLFFGAGVGAFVSPLFRLSFFMGGAIGLFLGAGVAYVLFFEPWRKGYGIFSSPQETDDSSGNEEEESDISEFIRDSFEAEGIDTEAEVEFIPGEEDSEEEGELQDESELTDEETSEDETSSDLQEDVEESGNEFEEADEELEPGEEYEMEDESLEEDSELDETEEESDEELDEQSTMPAFHTHRNQIHSSYDEYDNNEPRGLKAWLTPTQLPITLAGIWFFTSTYISGNYPEITGTIPDYLPVWFFTILPIFFLIGLSGFIGLLFRESSETLEVSVAENATYMINLLKLFTGWGIGLYAILVNL